ncbi:ABC transporter substrate-binding protein [Maledivibacter halophilus]|uniref:Carbohydrate ABC transporter substrate-binding protein, CUT1 family n=1 Tax=Maledivibacter halophilus TaxID=36842 RepID=A0A1T5JJW2_9FIRM|nr:extracellular solute-binding protein [Maledivibacter halophilus]SKC51699.1 carbohydrate ABC transporter substrate-binding protein, CUT1 family [Maledivibacter halophilus]
MKPIKYRPFTLFLCFALIIFILFAPHFLIRPKIDELIDKVFEKEIQWKGIITVRDYPRLDVSTGYKYSWITNKIKEFERNNPGVFIEFKPLDPELGHIEIEESINTNSYPDIAPIGANTEIISKGVLEPLDKYLTEEEIDKYKENAIAAVKKDNKIWGIPYMMETYCLFLNLDIFNERGVDPPREGIWTYEEFLEKLKQLTYDKNGDGKVDISGFNSYIGPNSYSTWGILLSDGGEIIDQKGKTYRFYGEEAVSGLKKLVDLKLLHKVTPESFGNNSSMKAWRSFAVDKEIAVYPAKTSNMSILKVLSNRGKGFNFGVANYPIGKAGLPVLPGNTVTAYGIFKQEDKKKLEMCLKFLRHLVDDESGESLYNQGVFPAKKNVGKIYREDKIMGRLEKEIDYSGTIGHDLKWKLIDDILQNQIKIALKGEKTPEEAIKAAKENIEGKLIR